MTLTALKCRHCHVDTENLGGVCKRCLPEVGPRGGIPREHRTDYKRGYKGLHGGHPPGINRRLVNVAPFGWLLMVRIGYSQLAVDADWFIAGRGAEKVLELAARPVMEEAWDDDD